MEYKVTAVIPAYNEEKRIVPVIKKTKKYVDEVIVIDDCSSDKTEQIAKDEGAKVFKTPENSGALEAFKLGILKANGDIIVKIDADGEHNPKDIPKLLEPIINGKADIVIGSRPQIERWSERMLSKLAQLKVSVRDTGSGFKAGKKEFFRKMRFYGTCPCGTFVLEADKLGAKIKEVPIKLNKIDKPRKIAWNHAGQLFYVLKLLFTS